MNGDDQDLGPVLLDASGRPVAPQRQAQRDPFACPVCNAGHERRRLSGGFGEPHDVCGRCGYDFPERTL